MPAAGIRCVLLVVALSASSASAEPGHDGRRSRSERTAEPAGTHPGLSQSQAAAASTGNETAVKEVVSRYNAARDRQDAAALAALLTEDADQLVSSGEWRKGRDALVRGMLQSSGANPGGRTITVDTVRFLRPDVALVDARYEIAGASGAEARRMWSAFVVVRTADGWRIDAIRNMLPAR